MNKLPV